MVKAPKGLSTVSRRVWDDITGEFDVHDGAGITLLEQALRALDRLTECQRIISKEGVVVKDRYGQDKPHPLLAVEKDARSGMLAAFKALDLEIDDYRPRLGRPPGGRGGL